MKKNLSKKKQRNVAPPVPSATGWPFRRAAAAALAVVVVATGGFLLSRNWRSPSASTPEGVTKDASRSVPVVTSNPRFEKLRGRWLRPDGGYVVEIKSVAADGKMDAAYFNPGSIHVAKAEASQDGATIRVFIELRDVNYPGSTYTLAYDSATDQLKGIYYQAALQETYDIYFTRLRP